LTYCIFRDTGVDHENSYFVESCNELQFDVLKFELHEFIVFKIPSEKLDLTQDHSLVENIILQE